MKMNKTNEKYAITIISLCILLIVNYLLISMKFPGLQKWQSIFLASIGSLFVIIGATVFKRMHANELSNKRRSDKNRASFFKIYFLAHIFAFAIGIFGNVLAAKIGGTIIDQGKLLDIVYRWIKILVSANVLAFIYLLIFNRDKLKELLNYIREK